MALHWRSNVYLNNYTYDLNLNIFCTKTYPTFEPLNLIIPQTFASDTKCCKVEVQWSFQHIPQTEKYQREEGNRRPFLIVI